MTNDINNDKNIPDESEPIPANNQDDEAPSVDPSTPQVEQAEEEAPSSPPTAENGLPPEAQGEANGGPLGCCLGTMVGLLLSLSLAILSRLYADPLSQLFQHNYGLLGLSVRILMGVLAFALAIALGIVGWKLGRRFYREYDPPVVKVRARRVRPKNLVQKG